MACEWEQCFSSIRLYYEPLRAGVALIINFISRLELRAPISVIARNAGATGLWPSATAITQCPPDAHYHLRLRYVRNKI